jgi:hypothetical protein
VEFEWDPRKALANRRKHGVSFDQAREVFGDEYSSFVVDPDHSLEEQRFLLFGETSDGLTLVVSFTDRNGRFRIISARPMTPRERRAYETQSR